MNIRSLGVLALSAAAAFMLAACSGEADIDLDNDTTDNDTGITLTPDTTTDMDTVGSDTSTLGQVGQEISDESVEKLVEAQLLISDGFKNVTVESEAGGVIVLSGTVASEAEKTAAEAETKKVAGVKEVRNNITIGS
jgi:hypothetical protein